MVTGVAWVFYGGALDRSCLETTAAYDRLKRIGQADVQGEFYWQIQRGDDNWEVPSRGSELRNLRLRPDSKFMIRSDIFYEKKTISSLFFGNRFYRGYDLVMYSVPYIRYEYRKEFDCSGNVVFENMILRAIRYTEAEVQRDLRNEFENSRTLGKPLPTSIGVTKLDDIVLDVRGNR